MTTDTTTTGPAALEVVQRYLDDHSPEFISEQATLRDHAAGISITGPEAIGGALYDLYHVAFPGAQARVNGIHDAGRTVTLEFTFAGVNDGPLMGRPPTGNAVEVDMCAVYRVDEGRIGRIDLYYDNATMERQLRGEQPV